MNKVMELVGTDLTHHIISERLDKESAAVQKKFGEALLEMIPDMAHDVVYSKMLQFAQGLAENAMAAMRPKIEIQVRFELEKQVDTIAASVVERVKARSPLITEAVVLDVIRRGISS